MSRARPEALAGAAAIGGLILGLSLLIALPNPPLLPETVRLDRRLDINTASADHLAVLPHLGPKRSAQIVAERQQGGLYADVADLARVRGIGPRTVARLAPWVVTSTMPPFHPPSFSDELRP